MMTLDWFVTPVWLKSAVVKYSSPKAVRTYIRVRPRANLISERQLVPRNKPFLKWPVTRYQIKSTLIFLSGLAVWSGSLSALGRRLEGLFCLWIPLIFKWVSMTCCKKLKQILLHQLISVPSHPIRSSGIQNFWWLRDQGRPCICAGRTPVCDFESSKMKCSFINAHLCPQWRGKGDFYPMVVEIDPSQAGQRKETLLHPPRGCEELCELQFMKHQMLPYLDCSWRHSSPRGMCCEVQHPSTILTLCCT